MCQGEPANVSPSSFGVWWGGQEVSTAWKIPAWLSFFFCLVINHGQSYFYSEMPVAGTAPCRYRRRNKTLLQRWDECLWGRPHKRLVYKMFHCTDEKTEVQRN